LVYKTQCC